MATAYQLPAIRETQLPAVIDDKRPAPAPESVRRIRRYDDIPDDVKLIRLWLRTKAKSTRRVYEGDLRRFLAFLAGVDPRDVTPLPLDLKEDDAPPDDERPFVFADLCAWVPLRQVTTEHVFYYADHLDDRGLKDSTQAKCLTAVKSLLTYAYKLQINDEGDTYLKRDPGRLVALPKAKDTLAERILEQGDVLRMIHLTPKLRDRVMLATLYGSGARVSELARLCWRDCKPRDDDGGQITLFGKGRKTRTVVLSKDFWALLLRIRPDQPDPDAPVFPSQKGGGPLDTSSIWRVVRKAAERVDIALPVSPHWLRHACASHSLDGGATLALVQATLGHSNAATTGRYLHAKPRDGASNYLRL
jgi:integrase/recombinase XerD